MGIYDRDYVRGDRRSARGLGGLGFISFNTWLIVLNVAIFFLGNAMAGSPAMQRQTFFGRELFNAATAEQIARAQVLTGQLLPHPDKPGVFFYPVVDPRTPHTDALGRVIVNPAGLAAPALIGRELFILQPWHEKWGHFSTGRGFLGLEVWRFITFQFLHASLIHLLLNMLGLWFVGGFVEQYLGSRRYAAFYLACGIFGAGLFLLLNLLGNVLPLVGVGARVPGLLFDNIYTPLVGASAGIFGVLMAAAFIDPRGMVRLFGVIPMKMRTAVYGFTAIALASLLLGTSNAGGEAAHVGGAAAGYFFIRRTHLLRDFFDLFQDSRKPRPRGAPGAPRRDGPTPEQVDAVLAKIRDRGLGALDDAERRVLRRATEAAARARRAPAPSSAQTPARAPAPPPDA